MKNNKFVHYIVIGDWSDDGHGKHETYIFNCSHDAHDVKKGYLQAVEKSCIALHDVSYKEFSNPQEIQSIFTKYEDSKIDKYLVEKLKSLLNVDFEIFSNSIEDNGSIYFGPEDIAKLFFEMVKSQIKDFSYEIVKKLKTINGYWSEDFNFTFGYGTL